MEAQLYAATVDILISALSDPSRVRPLYVRRNERQELVTSGAGGALLEVTEAGATIEEARARSRDPHQLARQV